MSTVQSQNIPDELKQLPQWVGWKVVARDGKPTKTPVNPKTGSFAKATDPATWGGFDSAIQAIAKYGLQGVGFVFSQSDPYCGIDLDSCLDQEKGEIQPWATKHISRFNSYCEITPSGKGFHIVIRGQLPPGRRRMGSIECYDSDRFFTFTGNLLNGITKIECRQAELEAFHKELFGTKTPEPAPSQPRQEPRPDDAELIAKACQAQNGGKFEALWKGQWKDRYPSQSEADQALCNILSFWADRDAVRIDRLFRQSGLYREKWERADYRTTTINHAIHQTTNTFEFRESGGWESNNNSRQVQQTTTNYNSGNIEQHDCNRSTTEIQHDCNSGATWSNKGVSALISTYMSEFTGTFFLKDLDEYVRSGLGVDRLPRQYQFYRSKLLSEMVQDSRLERTSRGGFRIIDRELEELDFLGSESDPHQIRLQLGLNDLVTVQEKEIIAFLGNPDGGKTAMAICTAVDNLDNPCCTILKDKYIYHFVSETGPAAFKQKLQAISHEMPERYNHSVRTLVYKANSIQDQVHPEAINIVDYLEPRNGDYREIVPTIDAIFKRLTRGVAIICIQQHPGQNPRGGLGVFEKPRLIVSLANENNRHCKMATILKAKNNKTNLRDLIGLEMDFVIKRKGTLIEPLMDQWRWRKPNQRPAYNTDW